MRKLIILLLTVSIFSAMGAIGTNAQTNATAPVDTHITPGNHHSGWQWNQNKTFTNELRLSLEQFFGNTIGAYFDQSPKASSTIAPLKWALISTQIFGHLGEGALGYDDFGRGTILNGDWYIYEYSDGTTPVVAWVTPMNSATVVAAAITHYSCAFLPLKQAGDAAAFEEHFNGSRCDMPRVTIFFKDHFSVNPAIRDVLAREMSRYLINDCDHSLIRKHGTLENKRYVAMHGHQPPPCRIPWDVVPLNELPQE
jgi:hypothetical protein